ncbi:MAG: hypothetical protein IJI35_07805 [Kiritimatiellae bacterium]|nr:hypothetical protein [Kiritimatiellia bacterium]
MTGFVRHSVLLFLALRAGDLVNIAAGMWFVPKYVSPGDLGAVLPVTSFATFLALPLFAFAMTVMRESAALAAAGERGKVKSVLKGVFVAVGAVTVLALAATALLMPRFLSAMRVSECGVGFLVVAAALLGCVAPVYTDALQALRRFRALAFAEIGGALVRFAVLLSVMPLRALAGYFAGQAALPVCRIAVSAVALRRDLSVPSVPFWNRAAVRRLAAGFVAVLAYQAVPMGVSLVEQSVLRTALPAADSAGYYMASRLSDFLYYLTFPLLLVMFPYTATAAAKGESTRPYVVRCACATLVAAAALAAVYALFGGALLSLLPNGSDYAGHARHLPLLVLITALTSCQVFATNAEVSAGRYGFLFWFVPLHLAYVAALTAAVRAGLATTLDGLLVWFVAASALRFAFAAAHLPRGQIV